MQYFFVLGNHPSLSAAELMSVLPKDKDNFKAAVLADRQILCYQGALPCAPEDLIRRLGGTIKLGEVLAEGVSRKDVLAKIKEKLLAGNGKFNFGFSDYGVGLPLKVLAMELKKFLKEQGVASRWVVSREPTLSSVVVEQNKLLASGAELVFFKKDGAIAVGRTLAVQPFKELSRRDYGRPARDDHSGMLPPKLAQIMLNLSNLSQEDVLLDPFCGSGTVLSEAALAGVKEIHGSDISSKAVADTKKNLEWLADKFEARSSKFEVAQYSATELSKHHQPNSVDRIVTEPYLGPQRGLHDLRAVVAELEQLYRLSLAEFYKILKPGGRVVMLWPVFWHKKEQVKLSAKIARDFMPVSPFPSELKLLLPLTERKTLLYGRPGQRVWREIVILEKK